MTGLHLHRILKPGAISPKAIFIAGVLIMGIIFIFDILTPADIRLHALYIFPLAAITLHCDNKSRMVIDGLILSVLLQVCSFFIQRIPTGPFATDALIAWVASWLTIVLARSARENYLLAMSMASIDSLTGLHNRRSLESFIDIEIANQNRYGGIFSLAMLDLNKFKALNDSRGHLAGDQALKLLTSILKEHTRRADTIARIGGDEFVIVMPNTQEKDCKSFCQLLSGKITQKMAEAGFFLTASIGSKTFESAPKSTLDAIRMADEAMYVVKVADKSRNSL